MSLEHAEVHLFQASMAEGPERAHLLAQAKDILIQAECAEKGRGAWRLACISALEGNNELCQRWLERARDHKTLPSRSAMESEPYLQNVCEQTWFLRFLQDVLD